MGRTFRVSEARERWNRTTPMEYSLKFSFSAALRPGEVSLGGRRTIHGSECAKGRDGIWRKNSRKQMSVCPLTLQPGVQDKADSGHPLSPMRLSSLRMQTLWCLL